MVGSFVTYVRWDVCCAAHGEEICAHCTISDCSWQKGRKYVGARAGVYLRRQPSAEGTRHTVGRCLYLRVPRYDSERILS